MSESFHFSRILRYCFSFNFFASLCFTFCSVFFRFIFVTKGFSTFERFEHSTGTRRSNSRLTGGMTRLNCNSLAGKSRHFSWGPGSNHSLVQQRQTELGSNSIYCCTQFKATYLCIIWITKEYNRCVNRNHLEVNGNQIKEVRSYSLLVLLFLKSKSTGTKASYVC